MKTSRPVKVMPTTASVMVTSLELDPQHRQQAQHAGQDDGDLPEHVGAALAPEDFVERAGGRGGRRGDVAREPGRAAEVPTPAKTTSIGSRKRAGSRDSPFWSESLVRLTVDTNSTVISPAHTDSSKTAAMLAPNWKSTIDSMMLAAARRHGRVEQVLEEAQQDHRHDQQHEATNQQRHVSFLPTTTRAAGSMRPRST